MGATRVHVLGCRSHYQDRRVERVLVRQVHTSVYFNAARSELGFTIRCVTAFLDLLKPITGDMVLQQAMDWAANRDVYVMQIKDEDHAYEVVEKATPIFEGFGVQLDTRLMATC